MMMNRLVNYYVQLYNKNAFYHYKKSNKLKWMYSNIIVRFVEFVFPLLMKLRKQKKEYRCSSNSNVIVSLTSFPQRIESLWMVIESMMYQTYKPYRIELYLSKEQFPKCLGDLPRSLTKYIEQGLDIYFVEEDLKPHKKYFYSFVRHNDYDIVTIDDDIYYKEDTLEKLCQLRTEHKDAICSNCASYMETENGMLKKYNTWKRVHKKQSPSMKLVAIGFGGVLYPQSYISKCHVLYDIDAIKNTCIKADDLWQKANQIYLNVPVCTNGRDCQGIYIRGTQNYALQKTNKSEIEANNDYQWSKIVKFFEDMNVFLIERILSNG